MTLKVVRTSKGTGHTDEDERVEETTGHSAKRKNIEIPSIKENPEFDPLENDFPVETLFR
jgi:hypothetical protein